MLPRHISGVFADYFSQVAGTVVAGTALAGDADRARVRPHHTGGAAVEPPEPLDDVWDAA